MRLLLGFLAIFFVGCATVSNLSPETTEPPEATETIEAAEATEDVSYLHEDTGLSFPAQLASLSYEGLIEYDDPRLGLSLRYSEEVAQAGMWADVYLYDLGQEALGTGILDDRVIGEFNSTIEIVFSFQQTVRYENAELIEAREISFDRGEEGILPAAFGLLSYDIVYENGSFTPISSVVLVTTYADHFLKVRISWNREVDAGFEWSIDFLNSLEEQLFPLPSPGS